MPNASGAGHNPIASAQLGLCPKPPETIQRLVDRFDRDRAVFQSGEYKEEQLRLELLNPLFEALGWDVSNKAGLSETYKPVIHEEEAVT